MATQASDETQREIERVMRARSAIVEHIDKTDEWSGAITCPVCGHSLHYRRAKVNGHIHAKCQTDKCVSWME